MKTRGAKSSARSRRRAKRKPDISAMFLDGRAIDAALRRAGLSALREHKRRGESIVVWKDGRVVTLTADQIPVTD